jgi:hypothetical protein
VYQVERAFDRQHAQVQAIQMQVPPPAPTHLATLMSHLATLMSHLATLMSHLATLMRPRPSRPQSPPSAPRGASLASSILHCPFLSFLFIMLRLLPIKIGWANGASCCVLGRFSDVFSVRV